MVTDGFDTAAPVEHDNLVGLANRLQAVRDQDERLVTRKLGEPALLAR